MGVLLDVYIFIAWLGSWSTTSGFGAFLIFIMWSLIIIFSVVSSFIGGSLSIFFSLISILTGKWILTPLIGILSWTFYFFGLGDWLTKLWPMAFPKCGYLFSEESATMVEWMIFSLWSILRGSSLWFMIKKF